jgi:gluconolactonase
MWPDKPSHTLAMNSETPASPIIPISRFSIFATGLDHPECVAFNRAGNLWAGGEAGQIYRIDSTGRVEQVITLGSFCAGLAFSPQDELFVCHPASGIVHVAADGRHELFASHAGEHRILCANFGVFDDAGNYYVTDSGQWMKRNGFLLRFTPDGKGQVLAGPFGYANGLALSADQLTLYMVESDTDRVYRFALKTDGSVESSSMFAEGVGRFPDGLALDTRDNLYASCYASDEIIRIIPTGEKKLFAWDRWAILLGSPTNMAFGGPGMTELYVANLARQTITRAEIGVAGQPLANQR